MFLFCCCTICTTAYMKFVQKNTHDWQTFVINRSILNHLKLDRANYKSAFLLSANLFQEVPLQSFNSTKTMDFSSSYQGPSKFIFYEIQNSLLMSQKLSKYHMIALHWTVETTSVSIMPCSVHDNERHQRCQWRCGLILESELLFQYHCV